MSWPVEPTTARLDRWLVELRRAVVWRRRLLSAGLLAGAAAFALHVLAPPPPRGVEVVVAARDLPAGAALQPRDVRLVSRPAGAVPEGALVTLPDAAGRAVASPVRRGEVLTDVRLVGPSLLDGLGPGLVATPVRVADADAAALARTGDLVDVLAAATSAGSAGGQARLVASAVRVLSVPRPASGGIGTGAGEGALGGGWVGGGGGGGRGGGARAPAPDRRPPGGCRGHRPHLSRRARPVTADQSL